MKGFFPSSEVQQETPVERWMPVEGFDGYEVSDMGRVRSLDRRIFYCDGRVYWKQGQIVSPFVNYRRGDYLYVRLSRKGKQHTFRLHRLVAIHFIHNSGSKSEVNHMDRDKGNCRVSNLVWSTPKENGEHAAKTGLSITKLSKDQVIEIRRRIGRGERKPILAEEYGVTLQNIYAIVYCRTWRWL
jgi:hypothetical protein